MLISMRWGLRTCSATTYVFPSVDSSSKNLTPGTTRFTQVCASLRSFKLGSLRIPAPLPRCASKIVNTCTRLAGSSQSPVSFATTLSVRQLWILLRRILRCELNDSHKFVRRVAPSNLVLCLFHAAYSTLYFLHTSTMLAGSRPDEARSDSSVKKRRPYHSVWPSFLINQRLPIILAIARKKVMQYDLCVALLLQIVCPAFPMAKAWSDR